MRVSCWGSLWVVEGLEKLALGVLCRVAWLGVEVPKKNSTAKTRARCMVGPGRPSSN